MEPENAKDLLRRAGETQRNINFIINQQARFSAGLQRSQENFNERWARADERWARTEESIRALRAVAELYAQGINELKESQARTDKQMAETDRRMAETGERLNALINFVERRASSESNGGTDAQEG
jgi:hypothetical protein